MNSIRIVATDLDGTLLRSDRTVSSRSADAMASALESGVQVIWATARARHSVDDLARSCGFRGLAIGANGAVVLDLGDGTPVVTRISAISADTVDATLDRIRHLLPGVAFATVGPTRFVAEPAYADLCAFADHHRHPHEMDVSPEVLRDEAIVKIVARHPVAASVDIYREVLAAGVDGVELTHSGAPYIEMSAAGVSKASALAQLCSDAGIDRAQVAAVGDAFNDLPMLEWAGVALCPANAMPEVLAVADRVLPGNDEDGVAHYLEGLVAGSV